MNLLSLDAGRAFVVGNPLSLGLQAGRASAGRGAAPKSNCPIKIKLGPGQVFVGQSRDSARRSPQFQGEVCNLGFARACAFGVFF